MSRSNYSDDCTEWALICWRGAVASAIRGARGQQALKELLAALDAMPVKELIANELEHDGQYCALGILGKVRGLPLADVDPDEAEEVADVFGLAPAFVREVAYENDEGGGWNPETPEQRWIRMRQWVASQVSP